MVTAVAGCQLEGPPIDVVHVAAASCFASRDLATLKQALEAQKNDREAFAKMRSTSQIVPVRKNEPIKVVATAADGQYSKVRLRSDPNDFWMPSEWIKVRKDEKPS